MLCPLTLELRTLHNTTTRKIPQNISNGRLDNYVLLKHEKEMFDLLAPLKEPKELTHSQ